jgi:hypothetical protein
VRLTVIRRRRPFWYSAINYYLLASAVCLFLFFLGWGLLHDAGEETPSITSGIGALLLLGGAVLMREALLKRSVHAVQGASQLQHIRDDMRPRPPLPPQTSDKLTIERNAALISEIGRKSDAAEVLGSYAAVHREIFDLCDAYLTKSGLELRHIGIGSPRLGALRKGRETVSRYHRYHLLRWAEIETGNLNRRAMETAAASDKVDAAHSALGIIDFALGFYPEERPLIDSRAALGEIVVSIEVSALVEEAEREVFQGNIRNARRNYRDALFLLGRDNVHNEGRDIAAERIIAEIEKLDRADYGRGGAASTSDRT